MRFDQHIRLNMLSMEDGFDLTKIDNRERDGHICKLTRTYYKRALDTCERRVHIKGPYVMDSYLSLAVSMKTGEAHDGRMNRLHAFVIGCCLVRQGLHCNFSAFVVECVNNLANCVGTINDDTFSLLHMVMPVLFISPVRDVQDGLTLFLSCCSVFSGKDRKSYRFGRAGNSSPMLAALKQLAQCIVVWEVLFARGW